VITTVFSLRHGIFEVFPFLYILPIILSVYFYPRRAVLFSLGISLLYISIVYLMGSSDPNNIAIATAWFAIFIVIGVVASSYANQILDERARIYSILHNSQDGVFCLDFQTLKIDDVNTKCARWLRYDREELIGKDLQAIWSDAAERDRFITDVKSCHKAGETETLFRAKDGTILRFIISAVVVTGNKVLCSAIDITGNKLNDEEIRKTLEDLEEQVKKRTEHLEKINEELRAEILERRRMESMLLSRAKKHPEKEDK
jgi:PAS domain S-box-containing protein